MVRWAALLLLLTSPVQAEGLAKAAQSQVGVTVIYDPSYVGLDFPGGDIPRARGVCSDVIIRALRDAYDIDLQLAVNRDMKAAFSDYPKIWGLSTTDRNIDHRRVPNLETLLRRIGAAQEPSDDPNDFEAGDIVSWRLNGSNLPHIGIVSDQRSADGTRPLITHNIGRGTLTEDVLFEHEMVLRARLDEAARKRLMALAD
ncbi:DUF1287 domain-containing protein [Roseovarius sp. 2305UL8-3]|uniref:DUF1287 domain-containing protein n=1 Tax=Roseovarius conchicola TaxID=3121636 RepID=UPI003527CE7F